ncbi:hypothetical protein ASG42_30250 [Rhizobium sp. Leaf391]|uniref:hypothetical protein n=1 Tax=Rhizobium sp. Leaf391 TaxID=1736360 RepID=UPI0007139B87|nr:hypothetical protein [Rhizobium sp. Leaf391]KQS95082.1 hypothetical protein ASG42_30250 [Rhizobium sp. Leaf391]
MTAERRRLFVQQLFERQAAAGYVVDDAPEFTSLIGLWIRGDIDMPAFRNRYRAIRKGRLPANQSSKTVPIAASRDLEEVPEPDTLLLEIERMTASLRSDE